MPRILNKTGKRFNKYCVRRDADGGITIIVNYVIETSEGEDIERSTTKRVSGAFKASLEDGFARIDRAIDTKEGLDA